MFQTKIKKNHIYLPGYADDFLPISASAEWLQTILDRFSEFCQRKGLLINPTKCKAMCSTTLEFYASGARKPIFTVEGVEVQYTNENKYLGYTINNSLSSSRHMQTILSKLRKCIAIFNSSINFRKQSLLLRFARTYIVPTLHNLEFVPSISQANNQRFDYLMSKFFKSKSVQKFREFRENHPWLNLKKLHSEARRRYDEDF